MSYLTVETRMEVFMNLKSKAVKNAIAIALGMALVCVIAVFVGTMGAADDAVSQQAAVTETNGTTGRTAGVVLSLNELEEQALVGVQTVDYTQLQPVVVTAAEEAIASIPDGPILTEEERLWQNRLMADVNDKMNVRAEASADAEIVGRLRKGDVAEVVEIGAEWTHIKSGNVDGYVKNEYCVYGLDALAYAKENIDTRAIVTGNSVRLREEATTDSGVVTALPKGMLLIVDNDAETVDGWVPVGYVGKTRYISADYVDLEMPLSEAITIAEEQEWNSKMADEKARRRQEQFTEATELINEVYDATSSEIMLMAAVIQCEAGGECYEGQVAVGAVILNRVRSDKYQDTISEVVYAPAQFTPASNGKVDRLLASGGIRQSCIRAAQEAINGIDPTGGCVSFRQTKSGHSGFVIGGHVFF